MTDDLRVRARARSTPRRCARCLDDLDATTWSCPACATALHDECRLESGPCPTLGCPTFASGAGALAHGPAQGVRLAIRLAERRAWLDRALDAVVLFGPPTGVWALLVFVVPAFDTMFREVGVNLPWSTSLLLGASRWAATALGVAVLVAVLALLRRSARTRAWLPGAVFFSALAIVAFGVVALFLPLTELIQRL